MGTRVRIKNSRGFFFGALLIFAFSGCAMVSDDVKPQKETMEDRAEALADLDQKIFMAKKGFTALPDWVRIQNPDTWELIKTNLEIAEIYSGKSEYIKARNAYAEGYALLLSLRKAEPTPDDFDGDGIPNEIDKCPQKPEDINGFLDEDGCPEKIKYFVIITSDEEGNLILPKVTVEPNTFMIINSDKPYSGVIGVIIPGAYRLKLSYPGMDDYIRNLTVPDGDERITIKAMMFRKK
ncbi:MAG: hypothetical protein Kow0090_19660 [Myxococcota bacterium]